MMDLVASVLGSPRVGLDVDQIADALWLAQFLSAPERAAVTPGPVAADEPGPAAQADLPIDPERPPRTEPRPGPAGPELAPGQVDIARPPVTSELAPDAVRFRSPAASALSRQLQVARALRPLGWLSPRPGAWHLLEELTADRIARTGLWLAELAPDTEPALDLVVVVDTSPRLRVWRRVTHELIDVLRSSGSFRMTTTWTLTGDQPDLVIRSAGGEICRAPQHLAGPGQRTAMLVISDFAGPLWKSDAGLACVRLWSQRTMMALVSLVPQRSWGRTSLGPLPATRLSSIRRGCPSASLRSEAAVVAGAIPIPVVSLDPASLGTWARLVAGHARVRGRGVLALSDTSPAAQARYAAAAMQAECGGDIEDMLTALRLVTLQTRATEAPLDARERVERFHETHRPEVVELAAALISAPLELSVMLVVQRAVAPRTGTLELAEIIDSGLLEIEPQQPGDDEVRFRIADDVRDHLSPLASIGGHLRVLEVVGAYLRDHLGSSIDFEALVVDPSRPVGPIADKDRRFARMFVTELRRLGIDIDLLAHLQPPDPELSVAPEPTTLDDLADRYDRVREQDAGPGRKAKLDLVVDQAVQAAAGAPAEDASALWRRGTPGARAVALAVCWSNPAAAPIEIIVESLEQLRGAHEPWIALQALRQVAVARHPLDTDPAIAALVRRLRLGEGFGGDLTVLATQILAAYLERCALSPALVARLDVVDEWLRAGEQTVAGACMAFIGSVPASPWAHGDLAEALGGELVLRGWEVIAAPGREVGARATLGAKRADGIVQLAVDGGEALLDRADCVIAMAGHTGTERAWKLARARKLPVVAVAFTGGTAERVWPVAQRDLLARGVPGELLSPLDAVPVAGDAARLIARVAGVVVARTPAARAGERPPSRAALRKVSGLVSRAFAAHELAMLAQDVDLDLSPQRSLSRSAFHVADDLVTLCAAQGVLDRLVFAMLRRRPAWMLEITHTLDMYPWTGNTAVDHYLTLYRDPESWGHECLDAGSCVCEVRVDGRAVGTGFLVGSDAVLTSYHAIGGQVLRAPDARSRLAFVFDRIPMLSTSSAGVIVPPADTSWKLATSPPAPGELSDSNRGAPSDDQLDFALIRLSRAVGVEPRHHRARSWLHAEARSARFQSVAIPHYSKYRGLTLALSDSGEYELSRNATRVRYTIDVQRGSSGAPVFDAATWKLVALHQRTTHNGRQQGIPIARIARHPAVQRYLARHSG